MSDYEIRFGDGILVGWLLGLIFFGLLASYLGYHTDIEIIEKGHGYYHPETGEFTWRAKAAGENQ